MNKLQLVIKGFQKEADLCFSEDAEKLKNVLFSAVNSINTFLLQVNSGATVSMEEFLHNPSTLMEFCRQTVVQVYHEKIFSSALLEGLKTAVTFCQDRDDLNPDDNLNNKCDIMCSSLELCSSLPE